MLSHDAHHLNLDCGIAYSRIASWLDDDLALPRNDGRWVFAAGQGTCSISAEPLESRSFSRIELERTHLVAEGDSDALEVFEKLFTLRFISAGG